MSCQSTMHRRNPSSPVGAATLHDNSGGSDGSGRRNRLSLRYGRFGMIMTLLCLGAPLSTLAFVSNVQRPSAAKPLSSRTSFLPPMRRTPTSSNTQLSMFMGSEGGILGIGTPELVRFYWNKGGRTTISYLV